MFAFKFKIRPFKSTQEPKCILHIIQHPFRTASAQKMSESFLSSDTADLSDARYVAW